MKKALVFLGLLALLCAGTGVSIAGHGPRHGGYHSPRPRHSGWYGGWGRPWRNPYWGPRPYYYRYPYRCPRPVIYRPYPVYYPTYYTPGYYNPCPAW